MKATVLSENLKKILSLAEKALGKSSHLPILETFLLRTNKNRIEVSSTNLEIGIVASFPAKIEKEGQVSVSARPFLNFINQLSDLKLNLEFSGKTFELITDSYKATLPAYPADEFPLIPEVKTKISFQLESSLFAAALNQVLVAASLSELRPELSSVYLIAEKGEGLKLAATDTFRLAEKTVPAKELLSSPGEKQSCLIPLRTAQEVLRIAKEKLEPVTVQLEPNQIQFNWQEVRLVSRLLEGEFPEYSSVIPREFKTKITVNHSKLWEALKVSGVFSSRLNDVKFQIFPNKKRIILGASDSQTGENQATLLPEEISGEEIEASFNYRYLLEALGVFNPKSKVQLNFTGSDKPLFLQQENDNSCFYILMPLRV